MSIGCGGSGTGLFGPANQFIKINGGDFIAVDGVNTIERLITSDLRFPYKQVMRGRIYLAPGQNNFLLNYSGLGDNITFLALKVVYDPKSVIELDNYVVWSFYDDPTKINYMSQFMALTGNSNHRIKQIYLSNPNTKYSVVLEYMAAIIGNDITYDVSLIQYGSSFNNLRFDVSAIDIKTHISGQSFKIVDVDNRDLGYILLSRINNIQKTGNILILNLNQIGNIYLDFISEYDAYQALSGINYFIENSTSVPSSTDDSAPVITYNSKVDNNYLYSFPSGSTSSTGFISTDSITYSLSLTMSSIGLTISKDYLLSNLIQGVNDVRDGDMSLTYSNILITGSNSMMTSITVSGSYSITFDISDIANNYVNNIINLNIL
jgi:hypothetical protein